MIRLCGAFVLALTLLPRVASASCKGVSSCVCRGPPAGYLAEATLAGQRGEELQYVVDAVLARPDGGAFYPDGGDLAELTLRDRDFASPWSTRQRILVRGDPSALGVIPIDQEGVVACDTEFFRITEAQAVELAQSEDCLERATQFQIKAQPPCDDTGSSCASVPGSGPAPIGLALAALGFAARRRRTQR